jgi:DNA-binding IclR family transcriptional regulator
MIKLKPAYPIKVLDKSLSVLDVLFQNNAPLSIMEISKKLGIYPSTIHRILDTLKYRGYVEQNPDNQKYLLGLKLVELGMARYHQINLVEEVSPFLKELVAECNETVHLAVLDHEELLYIAKRDSDQTIGLGMVSRVGRRAPLYSTGLGKILLAHVAEKERKRIIAHIKIQQFTKNTITNKEELEKELEQIRKQGVSFDREENEKEVYCIAVPVKNYHGEVIAALSVSSPTYRINAQRKKFLKKSILSIGRKISKRLGYNWEIK